MKQLFDWIRATALGCSTARAGSDPYSGFKGMTFEIKGPVESSFRPPSRNPGKSASKKSGCRIKSGMTVVASPA